VITLACDPANLQIVNDVASCTQWIAQPVSGWAAMSNQDFSDFLSAIINLGLAAFMVWWLVWAARRM
jgi:hypothetical protein